MKFAKLQSCGRDYICVLQQDLVTEPGAAAVRLLDRRTGAGACGMAVIAPLDSGRVAYTLYNPDGSEESLAAEAAACVSEFARECGLAAGQSSLTVCAADAEYVVSSAGAAGTVPQVQVCPGRVMTEAYEMGLGGQLTLGRRPVIRQPLESGGSRLIVSVSGVGELFAVSFSSFDLVHAPLAAMGPYVAAHTAFCGKKTHLVFARMADDGVLHVRLWETGRGEMPAGLSGACAAVACAVLGGYGQSPLTVRMAGGQMTVKWDKDSCIVRAVVPVSTVYTATTAG